MVLPFYPPRLQVREGRPPGGQGSPRTAQEPEEPSGRQVHASDPP